MNVNHNSEKRFIGEYYVNEQIDPITKYKKTSNMVYCEDGGTAYHCFLPRNQIVDGSWLAPGELVYFNITNGSNGYVARGVSRVYPRYGGTVTREMMGDYAEIESPAFRDRKGTFHKADLATADRIFIDNGELVDFTIYPDEPDRPRHVQLIDPGSLLERFAYVKEFDEKIERLAATAEEELWKHRDDNTKYMFPVLRNFIRYTFAKLYLDECIVEGKDAEGRRIAAWNTGLVTRNQEELFGFCYEASNRTPYGPEWVLFGFIKGSDKRMGSLPRTPELANYYKSPDELFFDLNLRLEMNADHIIDDNIGRFPKDLQDKAGLRAKLELQKTKVIRRIQRNYKTAVPQYARSKLQLLLPLPLRDDGKATLALLITKQPNMYRAATVLPLPWAYNNARLVTKPDTDWL